MIMVATQLPERWLLLWLSSCRPGGAGVPADEAAVHAVSLVEGPSAVQQTHTHTWGTLYYTTLYFCTVILATVLHFTSSLHSTSSLHCTSALFYCNSLFYCTALRICTKWFFLHYTVLQLNTVLLHCTTALYNRAVVVWILAIFGALF